jgi:tetratricopeptide (TPR) repeat protein
VLRCQQPQAAYPGPSHDDIQALLGKLDGANQAGDTKQAEALCREIIRAWPNSALGYIRLGLVYRREKDFQKARSAFETATRVEPTSFDAWYDLGGAYLSAGQNDKAINSLSEALRLRPHSSQAHRLLAQAFVEAGRTRDGLEQFLQSVESDAGDPEAFYDLGQACLRHALEIATKVTGESKSSPYSRRIFAENYIGHGSFGEAETQYQLALNAEPDALDLRLALGELYLRENEPEAARREIAPAVKLAPDSVAANYDLAKAEFLGRNLQSALASLQRIASFNPSFLASNPSFLESVNAGSTGKEECSLVFNLASSGQAGPAVSFLREACRRSLEQNQVLRSVGPGTREEGGEPPAQTTAAPGTTNRHPVEPCSAGLCAVCEKGLQAALHTADTALKASLKLGQCNYDVENYAAAYRHFVAAAESAPQSQPALYWEQEAARQLARTSFERVEQLAPDSYMIHVLKAQTWERQNQLRSAAQEYKAAIARRGDAANLHVLLGHLYWYWERYDDALPELETALRLEPADAAANYLEGDCLVQEHEAEKALPYLDKALRLRPGFLNAEASLGRALSQLGKYQEAVSELLKVAPADADGSVHFQLFQLYEKLGEKDKAEEALESFKRIRAQRLPESAHTNAPGPPQ